MASKFHSIFLLVPRDFLDRACLESVARESTWTVVTIDDTRFEAVGQTRRNGTKEEGARI